MKKLAVHLHLYYMDQLSEILQYLQSLNSMDYDLFVTMTHTDKEAIKKIKAFNPKAHIIVTDNHGYDIGPFMEFLHQINLSKYEYILKIHTKGTSSKNYTWCNKNRLDNKLWRKILLDGLLKNAKRVRDNLSFLDTHPEVGMLSSAYCVTSEKRMYEKMLPQINTVLKNIGFSDVVELSFVAGTMFYVRANLFRPLLKYSIKDFWATDSNVKEGTLAHVMERVFGAIIEQEGYQIFAIKHDHYTKEFIVAALKRFFYQKKHTKHRLLIKICKIPVYSKKEKL